MSALIDPTSSHESQQVVAETIGRACKEVGFLIITGHGIDQATISSAWQAIGDFFDLPSEEKKVFEANQEKYPFGYQAFGTEVLSAGKNKEKELADTQPSSQDSSTSSSSNEQNTVPPDMKEMFTLGPSDIRSGFPKRIFPQNPSSLEPSLSVYYDKLNTLARHILRAFAIALNLGDNFFD